MTVKTTISIEITKNDRVFSFNMPVNSPFGEAYDACYETLLQIVEFSKKAAEERKPADSVVEDKN